MCNKTVQIKWVKVHADAVIPSYAHRGDSGMDLYTVEDYQLEPFERVALGTGLKIVIPIGYELQIRPRSGVSLHSPFLIANTPGTIDAPYTGEIGIIVLNLSTQKQNIPKGTRIAQGVINKLPQVEHIEITEAEILETARGAGGFGSTGGF